MPAALRRGPRCTARLDGHGWGESFLKCQEGRWSC